MSPAVVYVSPPGQKELDSRMEEMKRGREKIWADAERKHEEKLAALPPEIRDKERQQYKERRAEIEAAIKSNNGPCQVLNPPF